MIKARLYLHLVALAFRAMHQPTRYLEWFSQAEAIHRDLGHGYTASRILPQHRGPVTQWIRKR